MQLHKENNQNIYSWKVGASTFTAIPEKGARLLTWDINFAEKNRSIIYWPKNVENWNSIGSIRGGNPILFPFVGRSFDNGQIKFWKTPEGERCPMELHGYARQGIFSIENMHQQGFSARFQPDVICHSAYPYQYIFRVIYQFNELSLSVILELENQDIRPLPWCAGHHFYFTLPWHENHSRADYVFHTTAKKAFKHGADGNLCPVKDFESTTAFNDPSLVDRIHCKLMDNVVKFGPRSGEEDICIRLGNDSIPSVWNSIVTWTEKEESPFYCVEPWMGPPNSTGHKNGLHFVEPGKTERFEVVVSLG